MKYIQWFAVFVVGVAIGNLEGDRLTFIDCAMKGEAKMAGGGVIRCGIKGEA